VTLIVLIKYKACSLHFLHTAYSSYVEYILFDWFLVAWRSGNVLCPINEVTLRRTGLVLGWVTACGQVNHISM